MRYDVVIATLNRPESLANCLSMVERQSELPQRVVVVDAGDDHARLRAGILPHRDPAIDWVFLRSDVKSIPYQKNLGLQHVKSEAVLMPDDDSMLHRTAAAEMMAVFRADVSGVVGAVSGAPSQVSPLGNGRSQRGRGRALKDRIGPLRSCVEAFLVPAPFSTFARSLWAQSSIPAWVDGERFRLVEHICGAYLGARSDVAKRHLFDENMGRGIGYALMEDMEFSMRLQKMGYLLVAAQYAPIFHDAHPGKRAGGFNYGFCWIMNCVYACRKNLPEMSVSWRRDLPRFLAYKVTLYRARAFAARDSHSIGVLEGAQAAMSVRRALMDAEVSELPAVYGAICRRYIRRTGEGPAA